MYEFTGKTLNLIITLFFDLLLYYLFFLTELYFKKLILSYSNSHRIIHILFLFLDPYLQSCAIIVSYDLYFISFFSRS